MFRPKPPAWRGADGETMYQRVMSVLTGDNRVTPTPSWVLRTEPDVVGDDYIDFEELMMTDVYWST